MKNKIVIDGITYVPEENVPKLAKDKKMSIVRSEAAGVFFGQVVKTDLAIGVVEMKNARRIWYWDGAASLSQLAVNGTSKPQNCKFPTPVPEITVAKVIEIIPVTEKAAESINGVAVWKA
jgi:hypothetical protein